MGLSAAVVLMGGMASAVVVSSRSMSLADTGAGARAVSTDVQRDFLADLQRATGFTERTATAVTFTVPDRTGDGRPETLRYAWSGTAGAPLTLQMNGGSVQNVATNVQQWALSYRTQATTAPVVPDESPPTSGRLLFVSAGTYTTVSGTTTVTPLASETPKISLFQSWGFAVSLIAATQPASDFGTAFTKNDVIFVSSEAGTSTAKNILVPATLGTVNENPALTTSYGFYTGTGSTTGTMTKIGSSVHYITTGYTAAQQVSIVTATTTLQAFPSTNANYMSTLGTNPSNSSVNFATLATGRLDVGGVPAPARRVQLPWAAVPFNVNTLTTDGQNLLKASLLWAVGNGTDGDPSLLTAGLTTASSKSGDFTPTNTVMLATPITLTAKSQILELAAYGNFQGKSIKVAIYSDSGGIPLSRLYQSAAVTTTSGNAWVTTAITPTVLNAGNYWLAVSLSDNTQTVAYANTSGVNVSQITVRPYSSGFPIAWGPGSGGTKTALANKQLLMYGSYVLAP